MASATKRSKIEAMPIAPKKSFIYPKKSMSIDQKIKKEVSKQIAISSEKKYYDRIFNNTSLLNTGQTINLLATIARGTSANERVGDKINITSVQLRGEFEVGDATNTVRMIVFQWYKDPNAAFNVVTDVLDNAAVSGGNGVFSPYNYNSSGTYQVLYDKIYRLDNQGPQSAIFDFKIKKIPKRKVTFLNASNQPIDNSIIVLFISDSGATPNPTFNFVSRVYFTDE